MVGLGVYTKILLLINTFMHNAYVTVNYLKIYIPIFYSGDAKINCPFPGYTFEITIYLQQHTQ